MHPPQETRPEKMCRTAPFAGRAATAALISCVRACLPTCLANLRVEVDVTICVGKLLVRTASSPAYGTIAELRSSCQPQELLLLLSPSHASLRFSSDKLGHSQREQLHPEQHSIFFLWQLEMLITPLLQVFSAVS
jgi:hypothetical protein